MAKNDNLVHYLTDIADAIREKNGTSDPINAQDFAEEIRSIGENGEIELTRNDVNFFDYDGTLLYAYTWEEAKNLTELPTAPSHVGITFKEWNYTLADIKEQGSDLLVYIYGCAHQYLGEYLVHNPETGQNKMLHVWRDLEYEDGYYDLLTNSTDINIGDVAYWGMVDEDNWILDVDGDGIPYEDLIEDYKCVIGKADVGACFIDSDGNAVSNPSNVIIIPRGEEEISSYCYQGLFNVVSIPNTIKNIYGNAFEYSYITCELKIPKECYVADHYMAFYMCFVQAYWQNYATVYYDYIDGVLGIPFGIQDGIKELNNFLEHFDYAHVIYPNSIETIGTLYSNNNRYGTVLADFTALDHIPEIDAAYYRGTPTIIVPDDLYDEWINSTNWSTYSEFIVKASDYNLNLK